MSVALAALFAASSLGATDPPKVVGIDADSRGRVIVEFDAVLDASTINKDSVVVRSPGNDGRIGTDDDKKVDADAVFNFAERELRVFADVDPGMPYSILLDASVIKGTNGCFIDGEFNASGDSGDGVEGGDYLVFARLPQSNPTVRFTTIEGDIEVEFFVDQTPMTVANFFAYMHDGVYDETFFHRSVEDFVIQGGGFFADDLDPIPTKPPVNNEPGISNTRGTIAMAKQGGNPNSATNQFFFNLTNNSANLDSQNGGFTVFGEVTNNAGLSVMDDLADFETVDASSEGSAFGELPVVDLSKVTDDEGEFTSVSEDDLLTITRVAALFEVSDIPFNTLSPDQTRTIDGGGDAVVGLIGVEGDVPSSSLVDVKFTPSGDDIVSITLVSKFPKSGVGIQVSGAGKVGQIVDKRTKSGGLAFIVSSAPIGAIRLNDGPSGYPLNDVLLPDGTFLDPDLDGDGSTMDQTAILVEEGFTALIQSKGDVSGDIIMLGGAGSIQLLGSVEDTDITLADAGKKSNVAVKLGEASNVSLIAPDYGVTSIFANAWTDSTSGGLISAKRIGPITVKGDFEVNIDIVESKAPVLVAAINVLGRASGTWTIDGPIGAVNLKDGASNLQMGILGNIPSFVAGDLDDVFLGSSRRIGNINVKSWDGGAIDCGTAGNVLIKGDFDADLNIQGDSPLIDLNMFRVLGDTNDSSLFVGGGVGQFIVDGTGSDFTLTVQVRANNIKFGAIEDGTIQAGSPLPIITTGDWFGGKLSGPEVGVLKVTGGKGLPGDLDVDLDVNFLNYVFVAGNLSGTFDAVNADQVLVNGDVDDLAMTVGTSFSFNPQFPPVKKFAVKGDVVSSNIRVRGTLVDFQAGGMNDSVLNVGGPANLDFFPSNPNSVNSLGRILTLKVAPSSTKARFIDSYIIAGQILKGHVGGIDADSGGAFGIGAFSIGELLYNGPGLPLHKLTNPSSSPEAEDGFQVRVDFIAPEP